MKKIYITPATLAVSSIAEHHLCAGSGGRGSQHGFSGEYGNDDWINEGFDKDNPVPIIDTSDDDDFDSQSKGNGFDVVEDD